jgi:hypothetical protein
MLNALHPGKINETTKASQAEALAGADNRKYMTPLRTKQVVDVVVDDAVEGALPAAIDTALAAASPVFDDVLSVASVEALPSPGTSGVLYIVGKLSYHWNGTSYDQLGVASSDDLSEGTTNLYFTEARAKDALATDLSDIGSATTTAIQAVSNDLANTPKPHISPTPPSPVVNGSIWVDSNTLRAHILQEGIWAELATA